MSGYIEEGQAQNTHTTRCRNFISRHSIPLSAENQIRNASNNKKERREGRGEKRKLISNSWYSQSVNMYFQWGKKVTVMILEVVIACLLRTNTIFCVIFNFPVVIKEPCNIVKCMKFVHQLECRLMYTGIQSLLQVEKHCKKRQKMNANRNS